MTYRMIALVGALLAIGCGEPEVDRTIPAPARTPAAEVPEKPATSEVMLPSDIGIEHFIVDGEELFYVRERRGLLTFEPDQSFQHLQVHAPLLAFDLRVLDAAGAVVLDWTAVEPSADDEDPAAIERAFDLPREGVSFQIRTSQFLEFARFATSLHGHLHDIAEDSDGAGDVVMAAQAGRWVPPDDVLAIANQQSLPYSGAPSSCSGSLRAGTREVAEFLKREFDGGRSYGGYACRANTANPNQYSVHASGRAIDLFVPLHGGEADNDLGDPIANYLIMNSEALGIEFIVWDRTSWGAHRAAPKHRAYTGPHPHHDHLHIELSPSSSTTTGRTFPPISRDQSPVGYLDSADCEGITGWAQDPDAPEAAIEVYVSIGGPVFTEGAAGYFLTADLKRDDLCAAIGSCEHGFHMPIPRGLMDGQPRQVHVYGADATGGENAELGSSNKTLQCDPPALPFPPEYGVRRHIPNAEALENWKFDRFDIASIPDATLDLLPISDPLPSQPQLARVEGQPEVWLVEEGVRRHVPNPETMETWKFDWDAIAVRTDLGDLIPSSQVTPRPFLAQGQGPEVYLVEPPPALWADQLAWSNPAVLGRGQQATFELTLRNRGSVAWDPDVFEARATSSAVCSECGTALQAPVLPGETTTLRLAVTGPDAVGTAQACVELHLDGFTFASRGQGGPFEPTCTSFEVIEEEVELEENHTPSHFDTSDGPRLIEARGGCSTAPDTTTAPLFLFGFGLLVVGRRRRN